MSHTTTDSTSPEDLKATLLSGVPGVEALEAKKAADVAAAKAITDTIPALIKDAVRAIVQSDDFKPGRVYRIDVRNVKCPNPFAPGRVVFDPITKLVVEYCHKAGLDPHIWENGQYTVTSYDIQAVIRLNADGSLMPPKV